MKFCITIPTIYTGIIISDKGVSDNYFKIKHTKLANA